ncbi:MAG: 30S ribosomal protein S2 [Candidatus Collierbacteria bacterium GW2011_GWA1_42_60]|nr:MAG: 30S ribosomal protein S2 [Candidatus Collierbacteria bacterium GW2011_GWA1_42_60]
MATKKAETKVVKATPKKEVKKVVKKEVIVEKETATKKAVAKKVVEKVEVKEPKKVASSTIEELFEAGAHFGHVVKKWNPKMKKYLWGAKNGIHIFDLEKTVSGLEDACKALTKAALEGKRIVLVGTKRQAKQMLETEAKRIEVPFITQRWMGGLITNWKQVKLTLERLNSLKLRRDQGQLKKFTKREQVLFDKEIARLERVVGGIATLKDAPEVIVAIDTHKEKLAVKEANNRGALVIGLVDSNANPDMVAAFGKALEVGLKERKDLAAAPKANDGSN